MKLSIGIVGLPNVGKSTLFNHLTQNDILAANYPFATIDPNVGIVEVPDKRLNTLAKLSSSEKTLPAIVEFYDIAGLVKGASAGEGLGNKFLQHIREVNAIVHVLRCFQSDDIIHVNNTVDPVADMETINTELALKDLETLQSRLEKETREARSGDKDSVKEKEVLEKVQQKLQAGETITEFSTQPAVKSLQLLSAKKKLYLLNGEQADVSEELKQAIEKEGSSYVVNNLSQSPDLSGLIKATYTLLGLISFFTTGEKETRAWTIKDGALAPEAAGAIHTDFQEKFIRAEVVAYQDLVQAGSWNGAKQAGKMRVEGKDYQVADGDVMVIRHG